jgi:hypothetical protein
VKNLSLSFAGAASCVGENSLYLFKQPAEALPELLDLPTEAGAFAVDPRSRSSLVGLDRYLRLVIQLEEILSHRGEEFVHPLEALDAGHVCNPRLDAVRLGFLALGRAAESAVENAVAGDGGDDRDRTAVTLAGPPYLNLPAGGSRPFAVTYAVPRYDRCCPHNRHFWPRQGIVESPRKRSSAPG